MPSDPTTIAVALADKLDTLVGFWAIDEKPTGSKDPYAAAGGAGGDQDNPRRINLRIELSKVLKGANGYLFSSNYI